MAVDDQLTTFATRSRDDRSQEILPFTMASREGGPARDRATCRQARDRCSISDRGWFGDGPLFAYGVDERAIRIDPSEREQWTRSSHFNRFYRATH